MNDIIQKLAAPSFKQVFTGLPGIGGGGAGGGGLGDGDYGDIVVSNSGSTLLIDPAVLSTYGRSLAGASTSSAALAALDLSQIAWTPSDIVGDGVTPDEDAIMAGFARGDVILPHNAVIAISKPILPPSNRRLWLNNARILMLPGFTTQTVSGFGVGAAIGAINTSGVQILGPGIIDSNKVGLGAGMGNRKHGVMFGNSTGFFCHGFTVKNCTGYACFAQGQGAGKFSSGIWSFIETLNSEYHNEQMQARGVAVLDCIMGDGDGDIACAGWLHPFFNGAGCEDIHYARCVGKGTCSNAVYITASATQGHRNVTITDCRFDQAGGGNCLAVEGDGGTNGLRISNSEFNCPAGVGATLDMVTNLSWTGGRVSGGQNIVLLNRTKGAISEVRMVGTPPSGVTGVGIGTQQADDGISDVSLRGGSIEISGDAGQYFQSGGRIRLSPETLLVYNGVQSGPSFPVDGEVSLDSGQIKWFHQNRQFHCVPFGSVAFKLPNLPWRVGTTLTLVNPTDSTAATVAADTGATYSGPASVPHFGFVKATLTATGWIGVGGRLSGAELNLAASRLLGRGSGGGSGPAQALTIGAGLQLVGTELSATGEGGGGGGISDGDKGDVVVSNSGATWTVESAAGAFNAAGGIIARGAIPAFTGVGAIAYVAGGNAAFGGYNGTGGYWEPVSLIGSTVRLAAAGNQTRLEAHGTGVTVTGTLTASGNVTGANLSGTNTGDQFTAMTSSRLLGRSSAGFGAAEQISIGSGLSLSGGVLSASGGGGGMGANVTAFDSGSGPALGTTEATIGTVSLSNVPAGTPVLIMARASLLKDGGTTVRTSTIRVRRGSSNSDAQVGADCGLRSQGVASSDYGPGVIIAVDTAHGGGNLTYTVRGTTSAANGSTTPNYELSAIPLTLAA
ncbi:MAG TPA: hypothetical protein VM265_07855 [Sphingomicrobium sp.]|nr:hypothetical protein [Sphingomicrobium sp.]